MTIHEHQKCRYTRAAVDQHQRAESELCALVGPQHYQPHSYTRNTSKSTRTPFAIHHSHSQEWATEKPRTESGSNTNLPEGVCAVEPYPVGGKTAREVGGIKSGSGGGVAGVGCEGEQSFCEKLVGHAGIKAVAHGAPATVIAYTHIGTHQAIATLTDVDGGLGLSIQVHSPEKDK